MKGQTLIEVIIVIAIVIILTTGIIAGTTTTLGANNASRLHTNGLQYAQEGIEIARNIRDKGWDEFAPLGDPEHKYCVGSDHVFQLATGDCPTNINNTPYARSIILKLTNNPDGYSSMNVDVIVDWGANNVTLTTDLTQR